MLNDTFTDNITQNVRSNMVNVKRVHFKSISLSGKVNGLKSTDVSTDLINIVFSWKSGTEP